jgi:hypothetical protein
LTLISKSADWGETAREIGKGEIGVNDLKIYMAPSWEEPQTDQQSFILQKSYRQGVLTIFPLLLIGAVSKNLAYRYLFIFTYKYFLINEN